MSTYNKFSSASPSVDRTRVDATADRIIVGYHAHVYFNAATLATARSVCEEAARRFPVHMGRVHEEPVGPHPDWSCQLSFRPDAFASVVPWLALNRNNLVVFIHPLSGNELKDHRDYAIWMGAVRPLDYSVLSEGDAPDDETT